jgi:peptidoglycan biosynthesis protein MviN/MurJ (putative lipid II flippase)
MAAILMWLNWPLAQWSAWAAGERVVHLAALIVTGVVTYAASCVVLGVRRRDVAQPRPTV